QGFHGIGGLDDSETCLLQKLRNEKTDQGLVFDEKNCRLVLRHLFLNSYTALLTNAGRALRFHRSSKFRRFIKGSAKAKPSEACIPAYGAQWSGLLMVDLPSRLRLSD